MEQKFEIMSEAMRYASCDVVHSVKRFIPGHISGRNESLPQSQGDLYDSRSLALNVTSTENAQALLAIITSAGKCFYDAQSHGKENQRLVVYAYLVLKYGGTVDPVMNE